MIADIDPIAALDNSVVAACKQQGEIERLKLALIELQATLVMIQRTSKAIGMTACTPLFMNCDRIIKEALNP